MKRRVVNSSRLQYINNIGLHKNKDRIDDLTCMETDKVGSDI